MLAKGVVQVAEKSKIPVLQKPAGISEILRYK